MANQSDTDSTPSLRPYYRTEKDPTPLNLYVRPEVKQKMDYYVGAVDAEVGWMGYIKTHERRVPELNVSVPGLLVLEDVFLYKQEVSGSSIDAPAFDIAEILQNLIDADIPADKIAQLRFFAHSHANMAVYHSSVDIEMIDDWAATGLDWFISHVQNKKGEVDCRFDMFSPFRVSCPVKEIVIANEAMQVQLQAEIDEKVSKKVWSNTHKWQDWRKDKDKQPDHTKSGNQAPSGKVVSPESKDVAARGPRSEGTPSKPVVRHREMDVRANGRVTSEVVRQEIVYGVIIHEAISGSPAARLRANMAEGARVAYYTEYMSKNPSLVDPTTERPESQSRSIQRSETKKELTAGKQTDTGKEEEAKPDQTPTPKIRGKSKEGSKSAKPQSNSSEKKGKDQVKEEAEAKLSVVEEPAETTAGKSIKEEVDEAFAQMGQAKANAN